MTTLHGIQQLGQSIWYDNMRRSMLDNGELVHLIEQGVTGITSNPTIFEKAIVGSTDYDDELRELVQDTSAGDIYEILALADIRRAADLLRPVYDRTGGTDGYVSLEVSPTLARDTEGTVAEAQRLFTALDRPNVMIKIPGTPEGIPAIARSIGAGLNINVTLLFSLGQYEAVIDAYMDGLERLAASGGDVGSIASVASFFVSRVDTLVDKELEQHGNSDLQGTIAVANAKLAYARFKELFSGERWQKLAQQGARVQRPLWASTGTKNPAYSDTLYVDTLIGEHTVNTMPPATLNATLDHGTPALTLESGIEEARSQVARLRDLNIDLDAITQQLQDDGVAAFAKSFESLISGIAEKRERLLAEHAA
jgi:transaldolase